MARLIHVVLRVAQLTPMGCPDLSDVIEWDRGWQEWTASLNGWLAAGVLLVTHNCTRVFIQRFGVRASLSSFILLSPFFQRPTTKFKLLTK
jgi:hypothetical protein